MFVIVAIMAQKLPVAAVPRVIVMVMVFMMNSEFPQPFSFEFTPAAAADMRKYLQGLLAIALHALFLFASGFCYKPKPAVVIRPILARNHTILFRLLTVFNHYIQTNGMPTLILRIVYNYHLLEKVERTGKYSKMR